MRDQKNIVRLPVESKWGDEPLIVENWWRRLLNKMANWFQRSAKEAETIDELQQLRDRRRDKDRFWFCATILLNEHEPNSTDELSGTNVIELRPKGELPVEDD